MSLEDSLTKFAASADKLAEAMNKYADVINTIANGNPQNVIVHQGAVAAPTIATPPVEVVKKGRGPNKPKEEAAPILEAAQEPEADEFGDEPDPFADEAAAPQAPVIDAAAIKGLITKVKDTKGKEMALALLKKIGVETIAKISEKDYAKVIELAGKVGVTL